MAVSHIVIITWKPIRNVVAYIHAVENYSAIKKQWNNSFCNNMDGPRDYHSVGLPGLGLAGGRDLGFGFREMVGFPAPIR